MSAAHLRLSNTFVERLDWKTCIDKYERPHTLFYLDPPYWETEGYGVPFPSTEYFAMADRIRALKGKAITSLNDHPAIRQAFDGFHIETVDIKYTVGGGGKEAARKEWLFLVGMRLCSRWACFDSKEPTSVDSSCCAVGL